MASRIDGSDLLIHPVSPRETQTSLLSPISESPRPLSLRKELSCLSCNVCVKSKPAFLILAWNVFVGAVLVSLQDSFTLLGFVWQFGNSKRDGPKEVQRLNVVIWTVLAAFALLALIQVLYPLSGFLADVYCGRYKAVTIGFTVLWMGMLCSSATTVMAYFENRSTWHIEPLKHVFILFVVMSLILMIIGLAGYQANIIQLGLDQLLEAPSDKLGLFVHWLMWAHTLGSTPIVVLFTIYPCYSYLDSVLYSVGTLPVLFFCISSLLLAFTCYNHSWFYSEPGQNNPYKIVFKVLNFARKNKYPLCRSAFTYCDDFRPSRIDFAKERYGGPFTTPQVEDVKTFLRIVLVLLSLGPVFVLDIPASNYLFPLYALHISDKLQFNVTDDYSYCQSPAVWIIVQNGSIGYFASILIAPVYIWIVYSLLQKQMPKIFCRLTCSLLIPLTGVIYLLITDMIGHIMFHARSQQSDSGTCLFTTIYTEANVNHTILNMHWSFAIPPSILLNLGCFFIHATAIEFISAQSPHSMKGLLVGVFFAIKGLFQFISAAAVIPFAIPNIWNHINPITNCGFGYYLFTIVVASIGLVLFSIVVKRYRYRQRDERPYDSRFAEQYYERYIGLGLSYSREAPSSSNDEDASGEEHSLITSGVSVSNSEILTKRI